MIEILLLFEEQSSMYMGWNAAHSYFNILRLPLGCEELVLPFPFLLNLSNIQAIFIQP